MVATSKSIFYQDSYLIILFGFIWSKPPYMYFLLGFKSYYSACCITSRASIIILPKENVKALTNAMILLYMKKLNLSQVNTNIFELILQLHTFLNHLGSIRFWFQKSQKHVIHKTILEMKARYALIGTSTCYYYF